MIPVALLISAASAVFSEAGLSTPVADLNTAVQELAGPFLTPRLEGLELDLDLAKPLEYHLYNATLVKAELNYTRLIERAANSHCNLALLGNNISLDLNASILGAKSRTYTINITRLDLSLRASILPGAEQGVGFLVHLDQANVTEQKFEIAINEKDKKVIDVLVSVLRSNINSIVEKTIINLNPKLAEAARTRPFIDLTPPGSTDLLRVSVFTTSPPSFFCYKCDSLKLYYMTASMAFGVTNTVTNITYKEAEKEELFNPDPQRTELVFGSNLMSLLSWTLQNSGLTFALKDSSIPPSSPVRLTVDGLLLLFPGLNKFSPQMGVFMVVEPCPGPPSISLRGGKVQSVVPITLQVLVDTSQQYDKHDYLTCLKEKQCVSAVTARVELVVSVAAKVPANNTAIANLIAVYVSQVQTVSASVKFDPALLRDTLNSVLPSITNPIAQQLLGGIPFAIPQKVKLLRLLREVRAELGLVQGKLQAVFSTEPTTL